MTYENFWVDSVYRSMTLEEKVGQLFMLRAHSDKGHAHEAAVERLIKRYKPGGLIFFQGTPLRQAYLTNHYQSISKLPLLIGMDAEWGLGMRLQGVPDFPKQLTLGAIQNNTLIYEMAKEIGYQCHRLGVHMNFAPVADINNNANNPVIGYRSFGEDPYQVTAKSYWFAKGLMEQGVFPCVKHFPGHGDTDVDSHKDLPIIPHSRARLDSIELFPFRYLADKKIAAMMIAHLEVPSLDSHASRPATLSQPIITDLLKGKMQYQGLVITDAMEMEGVRKHFPAGVAEAEALLAGNDIILLPVDFEKAIAAVLKYIEQGKLPEERIAHSVRKILHAKYKLGLWKRPTVETYRLLEDLNREKATALYRKLVEHSFTVVRDDNRLLPIQSDEKLCVVSIGAGSSTAFTQRLEQFHEITRLSLPINASKAQFAQVLSKIPGDRKLILCLHGLSNRPANNYGLPVAQTDFIRLAMKDRAAMLLVFGNPYVLSFLDDVNSVSVAYEDNDVIREVVAEAMAGAISSVGKLPVTASQRSTYYTGLQVPKRKVLGYDHPQNMGIHTEKLKRIDTIMEQAIRMRATPGAVIMGIMDERIFYQKAFGHFTYDRRKRVSNETIYDLASITKVAATTLAVMKLYEQGKLSLDASIGIYLPEVQQTDKADISIRELLRHRAGLQSWIPFYTETVQRKRRTIIQNPSVYRHRSEVGFTVPVTDRLYINNSYPDSMWQRIWKSDLRNSTDYLYSDLGFYILAEIVERVSGYPLDEYMDLHFYRPMGLSHIAYNPWKHLVATNIAPSEDDKYFRLQRVSGYVHDMGAAMLGGVSGHAGLFSNARDLGVLFQMLLNGGYYNGRKYLSSHTIRLFTTRSADDLRRGLGFDMKQLDSDNDLNMSAAASGFTFGHLGFTGVAVWADPAHNFIFLVLTNRTYPSKNRNLWGKYDFRPRLQKVFYDAMAD